MKNVDDVFLSRDRIIKRTRERKGFTDLSEHKKIFVGFVSLFLLMIKKKIVVDFLFRK